MEEYRTQIEIPWLRDFKNTSPNSWTSKNNETTVTVRQRPSIVHQTLKQEGLEMKVSRFRSGGEWEKVAPEQLDFDNADYLYCFRLTNYHQSQASPKWLNDLLEEWGVEDVD
jgi:hypothetical protein